MKQKQNENKEQQDYTNEAWKINKMETGTSTT